MKRMDPAQNDPNQPAVSQTNQSDTVSQQPQQVEPVDAQQAAQAPPQQPVSGPHKEHAPVATAPLDEYITPTEVAPALPKEVKDAGVEESVDETRAALDDEHQKLGIEHAKENAPVQTSPTGHVQVPWTPEEVKKIQHSRKFFDSLYWLVRLFVKEKKRDEEGEIAH